MLLIPDTRQLRLVWNLSQDGHGQAIFFFFFFSCCCSLLWAVVRWSLTLCMKKQMRDLCINKLYIISISHKQLCKIRRLQISWNYHLCPRLWVNNDNIFPCCQVFHLTGHSCTELMLSALWQCSCQFGDIVTQYLCVTDWITDWLELCIVISAAVLNVQSECGLCHCCGISAASYSGLPVLWWLLKMWRHGKLVVLTFFLAK